MSAVPRIARDPWLGQLALNATIQTLYAAVKSPRHRSHALDIGVFDCRHIMPCPVDCVAEDRRHAIESPTVGMVSR
ncbi:hypothetical protein GCM10017744_075200 [Streptomyces antimycoticus]|uniref:Uncharacterized protein n=1 Tax=Streptomyces antimycoticus TaxID=68175 RepID=A0A499VF54_9ACTN|nr:hypothetical protein SSPO_075050 [Streptomyces antimycoticus]